MRYLYWTWTPSNLVCISTPAGKVILAFQRGPCSGLQPSVICLQQSFPESFQWSWCSEKCQIYLIKYKYVASSWIFFFFKHNLRSLLKKENKTKNTVDSISERKLKFFHNSIITPGVRALKITALLLRKEWVGSPNAAFISKDFQVSEILPCLHLQGCRCTPPITNLLLLSSMPSPSHVLSLGCRHACTHTGAQAYILAFFIHSQTLSTGHSASSVCPYPKPAHAADPVLVLSQSASCPGDEAVKFPLVQAL